MRGLSKAIDIAGGWEAIGRDLKVRPSTVRRWLEEGRVPAPKIKRIKTLYGVRIRGNLLDVRDVMLLHRALKLGYPPRILARHFGIEWETVRKWVSKGEVPRKWHGPIEELIRNLERAKG